MHTLNFPNRKLSKLKIFAALMGLAVFFLFPFSDLSAQECECSLDYDTSLPKVSLNKIGEDLHSEEAWTKIMLSLDRVSNEDVHIRLHYGGTAVQDRDFEGPTNIMIPAGKQSTSFMIQHIDTTFHVKGFDFTVFILRVENAVFSPDMLHYHVLRKNLNAKMGEVIMKTID